MDNNGFSENEFSNDIERFHTVADRTLSVLIEKCEELESLDIAGFEITEKEGIFELNLGHKGTFLINKNSTNRQLWWSSPVSGPKRYNYDDKCQAWRNTRDGHFMLDLFNKEISELLDIDFDIYTIIPKPHTI